MAASGSGAFHARNPPKDLTEELTARAATWQEENSKSIIKQTEAKLKLQPMVTDAVITAMLDNCWINTKYHEAIASGLLSDEDLLKIEADYDDSELGEALEAEVAKHRARKYGSLPASLIVLWRKCVRFYGVFPTDLLGRCRNLEWDVSESQAILKRTKRQSTLWGQSFCRELAVLIMHAIWDTNPNNVGLALQFAVICRTDDRRPWPAKPRQAPVDVELFVALHRACRADRGETPLADIFKTVIEGSRYNVSPQDPSFASAHSVTKLLGCIAATVERPQGGNDHDASESRPPGEPYKVRLMDVRAVRDALDRFEEQSRHFPSTYHHLDLVNIAVNLILAKEPKGQTLNILKIAELTKEITRREMVVDAYQAALPPQSQERTRQSVSPGLHSGNSEPGPNDDEMNPDDDLDWSGDFGYTGGSAADSSGPLELQVSSLDLATSRSNSVHTSAIEQAVASAPELSDGCHRNEYLAKPNWNRGALQVQDLVCDANENK